MKYVQKYIYSVVEDKIEKKHQIEKKNCRNVNLGGGADQYRKTYV